MTVKEWCRKWQCSEATFYRLQRKGQAPRVVKVGRLVRITPEADAEFRSRYSRDRLPRAA